MPNEKVRRAYKAVQKQTFVPQHRFDPLGDGRKTGWLRVGWHIDADHPVVIGAGWYQLEKTQVVAEIVRRGPEGMPVLPGSSLKGAVRQVYEMLTPSCQQGTDPLCQVKASDSNPEICPACSLFGTGGLGGRLAFGEAKPADGSWRQELQKVRTPFPWEPTKFEKRTVKIYHQSKGDREEAERSWSVSGDFTSRLKFVNASDQELGLLFASLGFGAKSPMLRLGGKKYHGLGGVDVTIDGVEQRYPSVAPKEEPEAKAWARKLANSVLNEDQDRKRAWDELHAALLK